MRIPGISGDGDSGADAPSTVRASFWLWIAVATLGLVNVVFAYWSKTAAIEVLKKANPQLTQDQIATGVDRALTMFLVISLVFAGLYVWFAIKAKAGTKWARAALTILALTNLLFDYLVVVNLVTLVAVLLSVAGVVLLYLPKSTAYFKPEQG